jgi:heme-degrading monooxygenase HmoA
VFHHIVFFKLKERGNRGAAEKIRDALEAMRGRIPMLRHLEIGIDELHTDRSWDVALVTRFDSRDDMEAYQVHPVHKEAIAIIAQHREQSMVVDWTT